MNISTKVVSEVMSKNVLVAHTSYSFTDVWRLFYEMNIHHLPVLDEQKRLIGMISVNDVMNVMSRRLPHLGEVNETVLNGSFSIVEVMTPTPVTIAASDTVGKAAQIFAENNFNALPVVERGQLVGIITSRDVIEVMAKERSRSLLKDIPITFF